GHTATASSRTCRRPLRTFVLGRTGSITAWRRCGLAESQRPCYGPGSRQSGPPPRPPPLGKLLGLRYDSPLTVVPKRHSRCTTNPTEREPRNRLRRAAGGAPSRGWREAPPGVVNIHARSP